MSIITAKAGNGTEDKRTLQLLLVILKLPLLYAHQVVTWTTSTAAAGQLT